MKIKHLIIIAVILGGITLPLIVLGQSVFFPSATGPQYVIDISDGCAQWASNILTTSGSGCGGSATTIATTSSIAAPGITYFTKTSGVTTLGSISSSTVAQFVFPFTTYGMSTTTIPGFLNGLFSLSSTTINGAKFTDLTQGFNYIGSNGKLNTIASSSVNLSWFNNDTPFEVGLTAGDGLTRTVNDFDCDTASASVFGCLSALSFSKFNSATTTFSYPLIYTLGTNAVTFGWTYPFPAAATTTRLSFSGGLDFTYSSSTLYSSFINASSTFYTGAGLATCSGSDFLQWTGGTFGCDTPAGAGTVTSVVAGAGFQNQGLDITGSGTLVGAIATSATPVLGNLSYWTGVGDTTLPSKLGTVATTTLTGTAPIAFSQPVFVLGGSASVITCATATLLVPGCISAASFQDHNNKVATSSSETNGHIAYWTTTGGTPPKLGSIATSTLFNWYTPWNSYGVSTSTIFGFTGGLFSTASSTFSSTTFFPSLSQGFAYLGSSGKLNTVASTSAGFLLDTGDVGTGVYDFGGATSFEIPNGTSNTFSAIGQTFYDSTDKQWLIGTSTGNDPAVIPLIQTIYSRTIASTSVDMVSGGRIGLPYRRDGFTITEIHCWAEGGTSAVINLDTNAGGAQTDAVTCDSDGASDSAMSANYIVAAGTLMSLEFGTITGAVDYTHVTVYGFYTRE